MAQVFHGSVLKFLLGMKLGGERISSLEGSLFQFGLAAAAAKSLQSCPTLVRLHRRPPTRLPVPGILQARILEWVAISFSNA